MLDNAMLFLKDSALFLHCKS